MTMCELTSRPSICNQIWL